MKIQVRKATREDAGAVWEVHTAAIRQGCGKHYTAGEVEAWAGSLKPSVYQEGMQTRTFLVAEEDSRIVGFAKLDTATGEVEAVYVAPDRARRGVGRRLLSALEDAAVKAGVPHLVLASSLNAVPFYVRCGFQALEKSGHRLPDGTVLDCVWMDKRIAVGAGRPCPAGVP
jgi:putative acetyltransferase